MCGYLNLRHPPGCWLLRACLLWTHGTWLHELLRAVTGAASRLCVLCAVTRNLFSFPVAQSSPLHTLPLLELLSTTPVWLLSQGRVSLHDGTSYLLGIFCPVGTLEPLCSPSPRNSGASFVCKGEDVLCQTHIPLGIESASFQEAYLRFLPWLLSQAVVSGL